MSKDENPCIKCEYDDFEYCRKPKADNDTVWCEKYNQYEISKATTEADGGKETTNKGNSE